MKRFAALILALAMCLSLVACGSGSSSSEPAPQQGTSQTTPAPAETPKKAESISIRVATGHTVEQSWVQAIVDYFMPAVDSKLAETGNYKIDWIECFGGTVASNTEVLEATESGQADIGWVGYVFEAAKLPLQNLHYYLPFTSDNIAIESEAATKLFETYPEIPGEFQAYNQTFLGMAMMTAYNVFSTVPVNGTADLKNLKIGAAGSNLAWIEGTGAVGVQSSIPEAYQNMQTGVYDAVIQPTDSMFNVQIYEVAPYMLNANLGALWGGALTINNDFLASLPEEVQTAIFEAGKAYEKGSVEICTANYEKSLKGFEENKGTIVTLDLAARSAWANSITNLPKHYVDVLSKDYGINNGEELYNSFIQFLKDAGAELPRDWMGE